MDWRFWKKICTNNLIEDDKQVSLTPALLNRDSIMIKSSIGVF